MGFGQYSERGAADLSAYRGVEAFDKETGRRVRAVLSGESEVAHIWAAQSQTHGRYRSIYFNGRTLFSYGSHYVIGFIPEAGVALLNADSNSVTTNGHRASARRAVSHMTRHYVPDLTEALRLADSVASARAYLAQCKREGMDSESPELQRAAERLASWRKNSRAWLVSNAAGFMWSDKSGYNDESGAYVTRLLGWPRTAWPAIKREAERNAAKAKAERERRAKAKALADSKLFGAMTDSAFGEYLPADSYSYQRDLEPGTPGRLADGISAHAQREFAKRLGRAHKAAKAAGLKARTAKLWARVKQAREWAAGFEQRESDRKARELREEFETAREAGRLAGLAAWRFPEEMAAEINAARDKREAEAAAEAYASWQATPTAVARPDSRRFPEGSTQRAVLEGFEREEMESEAAAFERWREAFATAKRRGDPKPAWTFGQRGFSASIFAARWPDIMARLGGDPWRELLHGWTREEAERQLAAEAEAKRLAALEAEEAAEAWKAGANSHGAAWRRLSDERGGALLRIEGEGDAAELVTSHGARVPLAEAVAAFRFVKLIRERGEGWQRNGRRVRVGSYQLDSIEPSGDFVAGCHSINWPEIERVAKLAGVFEAEPSDAAEHKPAHA